MPVHDWTRVPAGIFHDFHHEWISAIKITLNSGILPEGYYSLAEQHAAGFGPDVLTLQDSRNGETNSADGGHVPAPSGLLTKPRRRPLAETEMEFYRRKQKVIAVRHVSDDKVVAMVEIVSPGNKSGKNALRNFVEKASQLLDQGIHILVIDVLPPGPRDPGGIHGAIWEHLTDEAFTLPQGRPLTLASYEAALTIRAYVENFAVGSALADMSLFLEPDGCVDIPLETTYLKAFAAVPKRWRDVLTPPRTPIRQDEQH